MREGDRGRGQAGPHESATKADARTLHAAPARRAPSPCPPPATGGGTRKCDPAYRLHRTALAIALVFALAGAGLLGKGLYVHAKAWAAQVLIGQAWAARQAGDAAARPWPWADTYPLAKLSVPRLGIERMVLSGASGRTLAFGPARIDGTALPGEAGVSVLSGHRDTHFAFLRDLRRDDALAVETADGQVHRFRVTQTEIVHRDAATLPGETQDGGAWLVLATCWPFDAIDPGTPWRYLVAARQD
ncbi:MAG: class GN sortase [Alphaproteobacteria bacterium]|nr:class GN sortase [Alphaproteobacteria bacterium]